MLSSSSGVVPVVAGDSLRFQVFHLLAIVSVAGAEMVAFLGGPSDPAWTDTKAIGLHLILFGAALGLGSLQAYHVTSLQSHHEREYKINIWLSIASCRLNLTCQCWEG